MILYAGDTVSLGLDTVCLVYTLNIVHRWMCEGHLSELRNKLGTAQPNLRNSL